MELGPKDHSQKEYPTETNPVSILCWNRKWGDFSLLFIVICCINQCLTEDCKGLFLSPCLLLEVRNGCAGFYTPKQLKFLSVSELQHVAPSAHHLERK